MTESMATGATIAIVVVNYGSHELLRRHLGRLDLSGLAARVVVVDNFSSVAERSAVERLSAEHGWQLVTRPENEGFGAAVNAGIRHAVDCDCFLILNPDVALDASIVAELREHSLRDPLALISPTLVTPSGGTAFAGSQVFLDTGRIKRLVPPADPEPKGEVVSDRAIGDGRPARAWLPATCLVVHRELLDRIGGFDSPYFLYWEDVDLSVRCVDAGGSLVIRHDLAVLHDEGGTQDRRDGRALSNRYYYWNTRNRLLFAARHLSRRQILRWIVHTPAESWQILLRGGRRQLLRSPAPLLATVRGSLAGIRIAVASTLGRRSPAGPDR